MSESAKGLRVRVQTLRQSQRDSDRFKIQSRLNQQIEHFIGSCLFLESGQFFGVYRSLSWEWSLSSVLNGLRKKGVVPVYPRVRNEQNPGAGMSWHSADETFPQFWSRNPRFQNLYEPTTDVPEVDPKMMIGVWVPGVAFSKKGERLGMGGGFYDAFLSTYPHLLKIAIAAEFQFFESLPEQRPDEPKMNIIIKENDIVFLSSPRK